MNSYGHIVTHGAGISPGTPQEVHAYLLTCASDFNGDVLVDGSDFGILLSRWACTDCSEDLTGDAEVDGSDVGVLLGSWWSVSEGEPCTVSVPSEVCGQDSFGNPSLTLEEAVLALGFSDLDEMAEWAATASQQNLESVAGTLAALLME